MNFVAYIQNRVPYSFSNPDVSNLMLFGSTRWARIPLDKRKYSEPQSVECIVIGYDEYEKVYKLSNIKTKNIFIETSLRFEEPLQYLQLVEEETAKALPLSDEDYGDKNESICSDISYVIYDISEHEESGSELDLNDTTHLPN